ncbi:MAG TPA: amino acid permease [Planctomycetota bacterium]|nr:amino acid permease [Planctomycetota bacterium]
MTGSQDLPRKIGFWGGSAIMVGIIVGSGIYAVPRGIALYMESPWVILGLWVAGGVLSLFGALAFAELGTMFPRSGGIYVYLREGFGPPVAFIFGWTYMLLTKPLAAAGIVTIFSDHFNPLFGLKWWPELVTCGILAALTAINMVGVRLGTRVSMALTGLKVGALVAILGCGLFLGAGSASNFHSAVPRYTFWEALSPVMYLILWAYDGWSDVASVAGEIEDPQKNLPRIFLIGTIATIVLYVAVNAVYISVLPLSEMRVTEAVAPEVMRRLLGPAGATAVAVMILVSTLGSSHGSVMTGARVTFAQAREGLLFRALGRVHPRFETPYVSLLVQLVLSCAAVLHFKTFDKLAGGFTFTMWIFYAMAAAAVIVLRVRRPDLPRPYKCWGYPFVPVLFILAAAGMTGLAIARDWKGTLPWLAVFVAGVPAYWIWKRCAKPPVESVV